MRSHVKSWPPRLWAPATGLLTAAVVFTVGVASPPLRYAKSPSGAATLLLPNANDRRLTLEARAFVSRLTSIAPAIRWIVLNADGSEGTQIKQAREAIAGGTKVLIVDPVDPNSAGRIVARAHQGHVCVIAFDRPVEARKLDLYVGYDPRATGVLQGAFILDRIHRGNLVIINGPADDDYAKAQYYGGSYLMLKPSIKAGKYTVALTSWTSSGTAGQAHNAMIEDLFRANSKVAGVVAQNDVLAQGALRALKQVSFKGRILVTGAGASLPGLRSLVRGTQSMTVYDQIRPEADAAAAAVKAYLAGKALRYQFKGRFAMRAGTVPAALFRPVLVTVANLKQTVLHDQFVTRGQICSGQWHLCKREQL